MPNCPRSVDFLPSTLPRLTLSLLLPMLPLMLPMLLPQAVAAQTVSPPTSANLDGKSAPKTEAAPENKPTANDTAVQKVEVKGKAYDARRQDTASKTVVTHEEIVRFGDTNLTDVLKRLPGVTIGSGSGIRFRGLGNGYTQVLLNGEPAPPGFQIDSLPPDSIEKIEILRSASAEFSTQSIAGTINIVTKNIVHNAQSELKVGVGEQAGHWNSSVNLQRSDKQGPFSYTLAGSVQHFEFSSSGYNRQLATDAKGVLNTDIAGILGTYAQFDSVNLNPRLNWKLDNGDTLISQSFARAGRSHFHNSESQTTLLGPQPNYPLNSSASASSFAFVNSSLNWLHKLDNGAKLDLKVGGSYNRRNADTLFLGGDANRGVQLSRSNVSTSVETGMTSIGKYSLLTQQDHTLVLGWDGAASRRRDQRVQLDTPAPGADPGRVIPLNLDENFSVKVHRVAVFGQDEWNLTKSLSLYLGLRWEGVQTDSSGTGVAASANRSSVFSPIIQTLWKLPNTKDSQVRLGLARTYKAPDLNALNARRQVSTENSPSRPDTQGNPNLRPELAWGLDLALEHFLADGGVLSASSYVRRINDLTGRQVSLQNGRWVSLPINEGSALSRGIELEAKFPLRVLMAHAPALELRFNLARNWSRVSSVPGPDNRLDGQTPLSGNIGIDYRMDKLPLTLGGNFSYQRNGHLRTSETQSSYGSPTRSLDMFALWKWDKKDQLRLSLSGVAHRDTISEEFYADANGSSSQLSARNNPINVRLMWEHKF